MLRKAVLSVVLLLGYCKVSSAQNEGTLSFMSSLPQTVYNNPAFVPRYNLSIGLPGSSVFAFYSNNSFSYNDLVKKDATGVNADLSKLYRSLRQKTYITQALQADLLRVSARVNARLYLTYNLTSKMYTRLMIPKDLAGIFINGTAPFIGSNATLSPSAESLAFVESALGASYQVNKDLVIGARIKILKGFANATVQNSTLNLAVDNDNYALTATAGMDVRTSGVQNFTKSGFDIKNSWKDYTRNNGLGIDLGATYRMMDRLTIGLSLTDIGTISWKNNTYGYSLDPNKATYTFKGVDLNQLVKGNNNYLNTLSDSIQNKFQPKEGNIASYRTFIPGKMYATGMYEIRRNFTAGVVAFAEKFRGRFLAGVTLGINKHFGRRLSTAISYSMASNSFNNFGAGFSINVPPFQIYMVGDNILGAALGGKEINKFINNTQLFNVRTGLNLVFGWHKAGEKQSGFSPLPAYRSKRNRPN